MSTKTRMILCGFMVALFLGLLWSRAAVRVDGELQGQTSAGGGGVTDHGALTGLADTNDHAYAVRTNDTRTLALTGDVGIGTNAPSEALHVVGDVRATADIHVGQNIYLDGVTDNRIRFQNDRIQAYVDNASLFDLNDQGGVRYARLGDGNDMDLQILTDGNVTSLFVEGSSGRVGIGNDVLVITNQGLYVDTGQAAKSVWVNAADGFVGINKESPGVQLDVSGEISTDADIVANNGNGQNLGVWVNSAKSTGMKSVASGTRLILSANGIEVFKASAGEGIDINSAKSSFYNIRMYGDDNNNTILILYADNSEAVFNEGGINTDMRAEGTNDTHLLFVDASLNAIGINASAPVSKLHVAVTNTTWGNTAITVEQDDEDQSFVDFVGTSAADATKNISTLGIDQDSGAGTVAAPDHANWDCKGLVKIEINGAAYWIPAYQPN